MLVTRKWIIAKTKLKPNINAENKQMNDCWNQTLMLRTSKWTIAENQHKYLEQANEGFLKINMNAENKQTNYCWKLTSMMRTMQLKWNLLTSVWWFIVPNCWLYIIAVDKDQTTCLHSYIHLFQINIIYWFQTWITFPLTPCINYRAKAW